MLKGKARRSARKNDVVCHYVEFMHICDEQIGLHGRSEETIREIFRICRERNILTDDLNTREKEIVKIMTKLFSAQDIQEAFLYRLEQERKADVKKAELDNSTMIARRMIAKGTTPFKEISEYTGLSVAAIAKLAKSMG